MEVVQEGLLQVVGLDAADVVRGGAVQRAHELLQRLAELQGPTTQRTHTHTHTHTDTGLKGRPVVRALDSRHMVLGSNPDV